MTDALTRAGELAIAEAERLWALDVYDPISTDQTPRGKFCRAFIEDLMRLSGYSYALPYNRNGKVEWCVMFALKCWLAGGLDPSLTRGFFGSTIRLACWARYQNFNQHKNVKRPVDPLERRLVAPMNEHSTALPFAVRAGDIATIGDGDPRDGDHCVLVASVDEARRVVHTIEGNAKGRGPKGGDPREGIIKAERRIGGPGFCLRMITRPAFGDLLAEKA